MHWLLIGYIFLFIHRPFEVWPGLGEIRLELLYMLVTGIVYAGLTYSMWVATREMTDQIRRQAVDLQRPWMSVSSIALAEPLSAGRPPRDSWRGGPRSAAAAPSAATPALLYVPASSVSRGSL